MSSFRVNDVVQEYDKNGKLIKTRAFTVEEKEARQKEIRDIHNSSQERINFYNNLPFVIKPFYLIYDLILLLSGLVYILANNTLGKYTTCPIALSVGCRKCPFFRTCPAIEILGNEKKWVKFQNRKGLK